MRTFNIFVPISHSGPWLNDGVEFDLTEDDVNDLNEGNSITTLTTQGEEIALFPLRWA